jgi:hypothetical protein
MKTCLYIILLVS